jgi:2,3-dihydroxybenzoate decarboxylase
VPNRIIALEEHFWTPALRDKTSGYYAVKSPVATSRLPDLGALRLKEMDEAGIDLQVISHVQPAAQIYDAATSIKLTREANDVLYEACRAHPTRFAGFASLPTPDPKESVAELERCVTKLGFKGAMISGHTNGEFIDLKKYWGIFERAEALDVPIYLHPGIPHPAAVELYLKDYPIMIGAGWGFGMETATQTVRLIYSGIFDKHPKLRIILGHLGEGIPFLLWRTNWVHRFMGKDMGLKREFADYFRENFWITTSGNFSQPALMCCLMELGVERVMFSVDWPYNKNTDGVKFIENAPISPADKRKILSENAAAVLKV